MLMLSILASGGKPMVSVRKSSGLRSIFRTSLNPCTMPVNSARGDTARRRQPPTLHALDLACCPNDMRSRLLEYTALPPSVQRHSSPVPPLDTECPARALRARDQRVLPRVRCG